MYAEKLRQYFEGVRKRINNKITCNEVFNIWEEFNDTVREFGPYEHYSSFSEFLIFSIVKEMLKLKNEKINGKEFLKNLKRSRSISRNILNEVEDDIKNLNTVEDVDNLIKRLKDDRYDRLRERLIGKKRDMLRKYEIENTEYKVYLDHRHRYARSSRENITPDIGFFKIEEDGEKKEKFLGAIEVKVYPAFGVSTVEDYIEEKLDKVAQNTTTNFSILYIIFHKVSNNFREKLNQWKKNKERSWSIKFLVLEANNNSIYEEVKNFLKNLKIVS